LDECETAPIKTVIVPDRPGSSPPAAFHEEHDASKTTMDNLFLLRAVVSFGSSCNTPLRDGNPTGRLRACDHRPRQTMMVVRRA